MNHSGCLTSKEGAVESVASGNGPRSTTPPRRGMAVYALEWCCQELRGSGRRNLKSHVNVGGARRSHYLRVCVSVSVIRPHAYLHLFFLYFW